MNRQPRHEISRRTALRAGAVGLAAATAGLGIGDVLPHTLRERLGGEAQAHAQAGPGRKAVVIGSGFGGSVAALRLGQAGWRTIVFERGRRWSTADDGQTFPTLMQPDGRAAWFRDDANINQLSRAFLIKRYPGLVDRIFGHGLDAVFGAGVGGGSLVFGSFTPQPRRREWDQLYPADLGYDEMDSTWYPLAKRELGVSPLPDDLLAAPQWVGARAWQQTVADAGLELHRHDFAMNWDRVRDELAGRARPSVSVGEYVYGTNSGAKLSLDRTYLPRAEATGNVEIRPLSEVVDLAPLPGGRWEVTARIIDEDGREIGRSTEDADAVFLAAGAYYTSALLGRLRAQGRLPALPDAVGKNYGTNGDFITAQAFQRRDFADLPGNQGGPGIGVVYDDASPYGTYSMSWEAAPFPLLTGHFTTTNLIQVMTGQRGSVDYDIRSGQSVLTYPYPFGDTETDRLGRFAAGRFKDLANNREGFLASGVPIYTFLGDLGAGCTWHSLGGMVMDGARAHGGAPGAATSDGRVHGYDNLMVVDGSLLPGSTGMVNPALTITAIAERSMHRFLAAG